ncbi:MAG: carbohydrate binding family 9 domain-containing protein, partial [Bacteroidales bacterium]|nr:carbohydrate binding family 9 domain-containing protein [Bacteroidales bacterium]
MRTPFRLLTLLGLLISSNHMVYSWDSALSIPSAVKAPVTDGAGLASIITSTGKAPVIGAAGFARTIPSTGRAPVTDGAGLACSIPPANKPPVIDGVLNDSIWMVAERYESFKTYDPDYGHEMPFRTVAMISYDDENLYFAFHCADPEADKIKASVESRDNIIYDDWVCINLDSFNDQQSLYAFYANPHGIQMDSRLSAGVENKNMDYLWQSGGMTDSTGYSVEMAIPLKSIRFPRGDTVTMGLILERRISRLMVSGTFPALDPDMGMAFQTQMMPFTMIGLKQNRILEFIPAVTYTFKQEQQEGAFGITENKPRLSLTTKFSINPQVISDITVNPDFSQVEADAGQIDINLRYQLFYPEKRPFFQEGSENFAIGASLSSEVDPVRSLVHTRKIINPAGGAKLTGKAGTRNSFSLIYSADRDLLADDGNTGKLIHVPLFRYKRALNDDSFIGSLYTGHIGTDSRNHVAGIDGQNRLNKSTRFEYQLLLSSTDRENMISNGYITGLYLISSKRDLDYSFSFKNVSDDFNSETGYIKRSGILYFTGLIRPKAYLKSGPFRRIDFELFSAQTRDLIYDRWETFNHLSAQAIIGNSSLAKIKYS